MRRKLWPKAAATEGALGQMSTNFQIYFINTNFLNKPNKKITIELKSYTAMLLYLFFDSSFSSWSKKMQTDKWPKAADSPMFHQQK